MDSGNGKKRRMGDDNIETGVAVDRLSSLPNDLIHKILSFISIKETVRTAAWSSRYRFIWTTMPYLDFSTHDFPKFVTQFLKRRNNQIDVSSLKLSLLLCPSVKELLNYAFSHNFPSHYLTTLYLQHATFCSDNCEGLLSKCANLKNLTLEDCQTKGLSSFSICHPGLANLTIEGGLWCVQVVNVVAPQLENLTIRVRGCYDTREHVISAPNLASFAYSGYSLLNLTTDGFPCLEEADICVSHPNDTEAQQLVRLLELVHNVKFLTLSLEIIEFLSSYVEVISHQSCPFVNLKSLTIYPKKIDERETKGLPKGKFNLSAEVKNYLLDSSPGVTLTMFSREEIVAVKVTIPSARKLMAELRVLLEQEKTNTKTKGKAPMESDNAKMHKKGKAQPEMKMQLQIGGNRELIKSYWEDLSLQLEQRKAKASLIFSLLERIEGLLVKLPAPNRAMIQPCFSVLYAEAGTVMSKLMKMQCDDNKSRFSVCFNELATSTTMEPSS